MKIDNFALTTFQSCPAKYLLRIREGWTSRRKTAALGFGGAVHVGLAEWYRSRDPHKVFGAIEATWPDNHPVDDYRDKQKCLQVLSDYIKTYPKETFTVVGVPDHPMIECTFTLDTGMFLDCEQCGSPEVNGHRCANCSKDVEPIEYGGIFDGLVEWGNTVYVLEHKSTSQLGPYYFNQFKPNNQITGYVWAAEQLSGRRCGGAIINAMGVYKASATRFERQVTNRSSAEIAAWLRNVKHSCQMIREAERTGRWPMFTPSCTQYGLCEFHNVHILGDAKDQQSRLETDYVRDNWSYEDRSDTA